MNFQVIDADGHVTETWEQIARHLDEPYRKRSLLTSFFPQDGWDRRLSGYFHDWAGDVKSWHEALDAGPPPVTANERAFRVLVRNALFRRVELMALRRWIDLGAMDGAAGWNADVWQEAIQDYFAEYETLGTGPDARGPDRFMVTVEPGRWLVRQAFDDPDGHLDWGISAEVDLAASDAEGRAVVHVTDVNRM